MEKRSSKQSEKALYNIASGQGGFFTTRQAVTAGYPDTVHSYHIRNGDWLRARRGVYQLARYPAPARPELMTWYLWSRGRDEVPRGVFCRDTALEIHGVLPPNAARLHMTFPPGFRRMNGIPDPVQPHFEELLKNHVERKDGYAVTTLARTVSDLEREGRLQDLVPYDRLFDLRRMPEVKAMQGKPAPESDTLSPEPETTKPSPEGDASWAAWV